MGFIRKRANGTLAYVFMWKGKRHTKNLGTTEEKEADNLRRDADEQLNRIRKGRSALASKLLADGHSIMDVLFGSDQTAHLLPAKSDDNPLTLSQLRDRFLKYLQAGGRSAGHLEGTTVHLDHFIRILGDRRVASLTDSDLMVFRDKRAKENGSGGRKVSPDTIRADFKSLMSAVNWAMKGKPPLLKSQPFPIPSVTGTSRKPFLPTEEIERLLEQLPEDAHGELAARWVLSLDEINKLVKLAGQKMPEMLLPIQIVCSTGMRRVQLVRLKPSDYIKKTLMLTSRKGARQKGLSEINLTIEVRGSVAKALEKHIKSLPKNAQLLFPIFDDMDYSGVNARWNGGGKRTLEQRRCDKADRLFEKLVKDTDFARLDGYHTLRHSFISILVAQGKTWDQIAAFVGHLDQRTTQRYIHFMPKNKRATVEAIPFDF